LKLKDSFKAQSMVTNNLLKPSTQLLQLKSGMVIFIIDINHNNVNIGAETSKQLKI